MNKLPLSEIDGRHLYHSFVAGTRKILEKQHDLNKINVFPVRDGDTGSNMAMTTRAVMESLHPHRSYSITAGLIADSTMTNARGNSGIIFSQFIYGLSKESPDFKTITIQQFAGSLAKAVQYMYDAVANPVEGTMLTVIKDWSEYIYAQRNKIADFNHLMKSSMDVLRRSLSETKQKLAVLSSANVVDAGANAFVFFIEGILDFILSPNIRNYFKFKPEPVLLPGSIENISDEVIHRYCVEGILNDVRLNRKSLFTILKSYGDSIVVGGSEKIRHIHVHTSHPEKLFDQLKEFGLITFQKADDMLRQSETIYRRKADIALVTDSTCDLPSEVMDHYQVHMEPLSIHFGESHYVDKVTIKPEQFYSLLDQHPAFPGTSQVNEKAFTGLYTRLVQHYNSVIAVHLTSKFSGTYQSSLNAAKSVSSNSGKKITVLDSRNVSGALGLIILRIAMAIESDMDHDAIVRAAENWIRDTRIFVSVKSLKYMVRGGRVSHTKGLIAKLLNINPIVAMNEEGASIVFGSAFSQQSNMKKVMHHIHRMCKDRQIWNYIVLHAHNRDATQWYEAKMREFTGKDPVAVVDISPVIGAHAGLGTSSVAFMFE